MAAQNSLHAEKETPQQAITSDGLKRIFGTGWVKPTDLIWKEEGNETLVNSDGDFKHFVTLTSHVEPG